MTMPSDKALRSVLLHIKKNAPRLLSGSTQLTDSDKQLLSAVLLLVAASQSSTRQNSKALEDLYATTDQLLPPDVAGALPYPCKDLFKQAESLLPAPPEAVAQLDPCILAYLYQFFCSGLRDAAKRRLQTADKTAGLEDTISFTQLYTPTPVIEHLLKHTVRRHKDKVIDPSCGAGSFLTLAFDHLLALNLTDGKRKQSSAGIILEKNIHGSDIDRVGLWVAALSLAARLKLNQIEYAGRLNLALLKQQPDQPLLGALGTEFPRGHMLLQSYDAVVGNPPYIGRKLLDRKLKEKLKELYPHSHQDLCNAFIERGLALLKEGGRLGYITQSSLLYLPTYATLRKELLENYQIVSMIEAGSGVFPLQSGQKVQSVIMVLQKSAPDGAATLCAAADKKQDWLSADMNSQSQSSCMMIDQKEFLKHRGYAFHYRCPQVILSIRSRSGKLSETAEIRQGLATGDNDRFIKWWWQVPSNQLNCRFVPYVKGAGSERWYAPIKTVIDWQDNGAALKQAVAAAYPYLNGKTAWVVKNEKFYFKKGLTFSLVNTRQLCVRQLPEGCIFDVAGSAVFPNDGQDLTWLAYLNSSLIAANADILNPTVNYQVGDLKELPVIPFTPQINQRLTELSSQCLSAKKQLCAYLDADMQQSQPPRLALNLMSYQDVRRELLSCLRALEQAESEIDKLVLDFACQHFQLNKAEQKNLHDLCQEAVGRRKSAALPFDSIEEYALLSMRRLLYELGPGKITYEQLRLKAGNSTDFLENTIGVPLIEYVRLRFESDQKKHLNNSVRVSVEADGYDGACLISSPFEHARSRS